MDVRIHSEHIVPGRVQPSIDKIAGRMAAVAAGHAGNRDPLLSQKAAARFSRLLMAPTSPAARTT
jgi:hypothetical protein